MADDLGRGEELEDIGRLLMRDYVPPARRVRYHGAYADDLARANVKDASKAQFRQVQEE